MNLVAHIEALKKSPLTNEEANMVREFQSQFEIDDDDPLIVVLAIMIRSQLIIDTAPDLLQQKVTETIELHRSNLREQAVLSAKELVGDIAATLMRQQTALGEIWRLRLIWAGVGAGVAAVLFVMAIGMVSVLK